MAEETPTREVPKFNLDDARDFYYKTMRNCERHVEMLKKVVEGLAEKKEDDEWLFEIQSEAKKGYYWSDHQRDEWENHMSQIDNYIDFIRSEADILAVAELKGDDETTVPYHNRTRILHPELQKFKLEKQARILGKYGGTPALGPAHVMMAAPRDSILKATASPAAIEIHYSKQEGKDTSEMAQVFKFKQRKAADSQAEWQKELTEKKGEARMRELTADEATKASTSVASPFGQELSGVLQKRQQQLDEAASSSKTKKPESKAELTAELSRKLSMRQERARLEEDSSSPLVLSGREPATPDTKIIAKALAPYAGELSSAISRRARTLADEEEKARTASFKTPDVDQLGGADGELAQRLRRRQEDSERREREAAAAAEQQEDPTAKLTGELAELMRKRQQKKAAGEGSAQE